ncbi:MAG: GIY-YIG nuclease family protein [Melioribacteraceae bacterium]|nr:GIY-YIG nuclease family protein [Melioribacteraceae bacterium]MCF8352994.1 GIY-YIG nuclease family protein [Melioribacteraceae bacterium]MCF8392885.1 GIY-YIG nuclease family protein [Melioribacteraceae bacterium]MCF8417821.1 GIY-YIG nuclease family protein [Melioribacteraceae bacterium]
MYFVYFLVSKEKNFIYVGRTDNIDKRFAEHLEGMVQSTKFYRPLVLDSYIAVSTRKKAVELEKYFKRGSGKAFLKKRILTNEAPKENC